MNDPGILARGFFKLWYGFGKLYFIVFNIDDLIAEWPAIRQVIKDGGGRGRHAVYG